MSNFKLTAADEKMTSNNCSLKMPYLLYRVLCLVAQLYRLFATRRVPHIMLFFLKREFSKVYTACGTEETSQAAPSGWLSPLSKEDTQNRNSVLFRIWLNSVGC